MPDFEPIVGRYTSVEIDGAPHRVHVEEAGQGVPLLCLHTAGADSRQYRHVLNDSEITDKFRVIAFDLPYHGRSTPADGWWLKKYRLTTASYLTVVRAVWLKLGLEKPVVMGCSMGGAIVLKIAAEYQDELSGIVGLESSAYAPGRYNEFLHHPAIHGGELAASYTYGSIPPPVRSKAGARTGGTTARVARAFIRAMCIFTQTTGTGAKTSSASTATAARSRCSPASTTIPARRR